MLSLLALLIAYDAISGERMAGTLLLTASGTVARHQILLGKTLAGMMTLAVPLTMAFLVAILMLSLSPAVELAASDWVRMGIMYVASLLFISAVFNGGLLISCSTGYPARSLMLGLFLWIVLAMVVSSRVAHSVSSIVVLLLLWAGLVVLIQASGASSHKPPSAFRRAASFVTAS